MILWFILGLVSIGIGIVSTDYGMVALGIACFAHCRISAMTAQIKDKAQ